jgi:diguanylate cyclase (GGDEF)-like protein
MASSQFPMGGVSGLSLEQERALLTAHQFENGYEPDHVEATVARLSDTLGCRVVLVQKQSREWVLVTASPSDPGSDWILDLDTAFEDVLRTRQPQTTRTGSGETWTLMPCAVHPSAVALFEGDWLSSRAALSAAVKNLCILWSSESRGKRAHAGLTAHRLARRLSRARGLREVYDAIVQRMPMAVHARIAALAVPDPADGRLTIVATFGYPRELVEHLRIEPRTGVFGSVFESGRVLLVTGLGETSSLARRRRPRYRTDSFIAMPLVGGHEVLGVICVTDRHDDQPFTAEDVSILRTMAAPAALALGREHAIVQAEGFALTAAIDPLSGAFNRRHFHMRLEEELQRSRRHSLALGFLMIDIDDFKAVNDSFGHLAGDTVIRDIAEILRRSVRVFDVCARFGGEEFAIIMPGSVVESAAMVAERIRERIDAYRPNEAGLEQLHLTVSIGLAVSSPGMSAHDLIDTADRALYLAKRAGKNRVRIASRDEHAPPAIEERSLDSNSDAEP